MRRLRRYFLWTFFLGSLGLLAGLAFLARRSAMETPRAAYEAAERIGFGPERDPEGAFRKLEFALRGAEAERDRRLIQDILKTRARLYTTVGSFNRARMDYETILAQYQPDNLESQIALAWVLLRTRNWEEARRRVDAVLARDPKNPKALAFRGQILVERAKQDVADAMNVVRLVLPQRQHEQARRILTVASARVPTDLSRIRMVQQLRELFPEQEVGPLQKVMDALQSASDRTRGAREALVQSFQTIFTSETLEDYFRLLDRAADSDTTLDFGLAVANLPSAPASLSFLTRMTALYEARGQTDLAVRFIAEHLRGNSPTPEFYANWCRLLWKAGRWEDLIGVAKAMALAGDNDYRSLGMGYIGLSQDRLGRTDEVAQVLRPYLLQSPVEPFPGAVAEAWSALARTYRAAGKPIEEASALRSAMRNAKNEGSERGAIALRLYELAHEDPSPSKDYLEMEMNLTRAMASYPERLQEFWSAWNDLGQRNLDAARVDLEVVIEQLASDLEITPAAPIGPYELFELARLFAAKGAHAAALENAKRILVGYPGFLPALDIAIEANQALGNQSAAARMLLARLRLDGNDAATLQRLQDLPAGVLTNDQVTELMRADPRGYGRERVLGALREGGEESAMLAGLLGIPAEERSDAHSLLAASLLIGAGRADEIEDVLQWLSGDAQARARAEILRMQAAVQRGQYDRFDGSLAALSEGDYGLGALIDPLLARGQSARALAVSRRLDELPGPRSGRALIRLAQGQMLGGDRGRALDSLARAESFLSDGSAEVGYLIDTVSLADWGAMPLRTGELRGSGMSPTQIGLALLDLIGEQHAAAFDRIRKGLQRNPDEPLWGVLRCALASLTGKPMDEVSPGFSEASDRDLHEALRGVSGDERDPRGMLVHLLALLHPEWTAWSVADLDREALARPGSIWTEYLVCRGLLRLGEGDLAFRRARELVDRDPHFRPGWDVMELADRTRANSPEREAAPPRPDPEEISWVRWRQREVLGRLDDAQNSELWMSALSAEADGDLDQARYLIRRALEVSPHDVRFQLTQVRLYAAKGDWLPALNTMESALLDAEPRTDSRVVERAIELHRQVMAQSPTPTLRTLIRQQRQQLLTRFGDDPLVALESARTAIAESPSGPEQGLSQALSRLNDFRSRTRNVSLDSLRPGMTQAWFEFTLDYDAGLATNFLLRELEKRPAAPQIWRMMSQLKASRGAFGPAAEDREALLAFLPTEQDARAAVELRSKLGLGREAFDDACARVVQLAHLEAPDINLEVARARFDLNAGPEYWEAALGRLSEMWHEEKLPDREQDEPLLVDMPLDGAAEPTADPQTAKRMLEVGRTYALALCWRAHPDDLRRASDVLQAILRGSRNSYERNMLTGLINIVTRLTSG